MITQEISKAFGLVGKSPFFRFVKRQKFIDYLEKTEIENFPDDLDEPYRTVWMLGEKSLEEENKIRKKRQSRITRGDALYIFDKLLETVNKTDIEKLLTDFDRKKYLEDE